MKNLKSMKEFEKGVFALNSSEMSNVQGGKRAFDGDGAGTHEVDRGVATCVSAGEDTRIRTRLDNSGSTGWGDWYNCMNHLIPS